MVVRTLYRTFRSLRVFVSLIFLKKSSVVFSKDSTEAIETSIEARQTKQQQNTEGSAATFSKLFKIIPAYCNPNMMI